MIKVYSTYWCPECVQVKKYFDFKGIEYLEINVADKQEDREEVLRVSGQRTVPVIECDGNIIVGFNRALIDKAINK